MGPMIRGRDGKLKVSRIGLLLCMDGFPAFNQQRKGAISLCPAEFCIISHPPWSRYDPDNMLPWLIVPDNMPAANQLKYFNYLCVHELNPLEKCGVPGPDGPVKIKIIGASLDLKGKEKFYHQKAVQSYCGCSTCTIHFDVGPEGPIYAAARLYLPPDHPLRARRCKFNGYVFEFVKEEHRREPKLKTSQTLFKYDAMRKARGVEHFCGQKGPVMLSKYLCMEYARFNLLEWMYGIKCACVNIFDFLLGREGPFDMRARRTSKQLGVFPDIWPGQVVYASQARIRAVAMLQDEQIQSGDSTFNRRWLRKFEIRPPAREGIEFLRRRLTSLRDRAVAGERIILEGAKNPLPWRLTPMAKKIVDKRVVNLCYPHYTPLCNIDDQSFIFRAGVWRTASKLIAFNVVLVTVLRGFVAKLRCALRSLIWGLRLLEGRSLSVNEARALKLDGGHKAMHEIDTKKAKKLIIEGLSMLEGCIAICLIVPAIHSLCHYPGGAELWGLLRLVWMISFGTSTFCNLTHFLLNLLETSYC